LGATQDDVINERRIQRVSLRQCGQHLGRQGYRADFVKRSVRTAPSVRT
jgi:hypothetical protein